MVTSYISRWRAPISSVTFDVVSLFVSRLYSNVYRGKGQCEVVMTQFPKCTTAPEPFIIIPYPQKKMEPLQTKNLRKFVGITSPVSQNHRPKDPRENNERVYKTQTRRDRRTPVARLPIH